MNKIYVIALAVLAVIASFCFFTVDERERVLRLQFGEIKQSDYEPGLHFKWPWQNVIVLDARIQTLDSEPQRYLTSEKKNLDVDSFVKWKIKDVDRYYKATSGSVQRTNERLSVTASKRLREEFGKRTIHQVVSGQRTDIMDNLTESVGVQADELGVSIVDVRIKRVDLPGDVSKSVYDRMSAERTEVAKKFRSEGEERAKQIRAGADRERVVILAEAERDAQKLRGNGDGRATQVYADAYRKDTEFYILYRSLNAYKSTFNSSSDILLIEPNTQFFRYFKNSGGHQE